MLVEFVERPLVENVGARTRAVEGQDSNSRVEKVAADIVVHGLIRGQFRFNQSAPPWPPPTHRETRARFWLRRCSSFKAVRTRRDPVTPTGWPSAIAPPFTLRIWSG